jgi:hypothetical protein
MLPALAALLLSVAPPPISLTSVAGRQGAVQGSFCTKDRRFGHPSICADTIFPDAKRLSVVRPGEALRLSMRGAAGFDVDIGRRGCRTVLRRLHVGHDGRFRAPLGADVYQLTVYVSHFRAGRLSGDSSAGLGLWVDRSKRRAIVDARSAHGNRCA